MIARNVMNPHPAPLGASMAFAQKAVKPGCPGGSVGYTPRGEQPGTIKLFVEEGRQYYIGARLTGTRKNEWEPVVWAVRDIENYEHGIGH